MKRFWRLWAKALGEKAGNSDSEADKIAFVRTIIILFYIVTNAFIIAGVIRQFANNYDAIFVKKKKTEAEEFDEQVLMKGEYYDDEDEPKDSEQGG